jgi:predicted AAA+ superfamily ATPase
MKRDIYSRLCAWKTSSRRKPLILRGARQTGKTYILKEFGEREFDKLFYFNFEEDSGLNDLFNRNLKPEKIIENLSIYHKDKINPGYDLIFLDEIQESNSALNSLKYFQEEANNFHIVAAGSLLGVKLSGPKSFPVGKVNFLDLYPMTFFEFLDAVGESRYRQLIEEKNDFLPLPEIFHEELIDLLRKYYFIGGMPEAVKYYAETGDLLEVRSVHKEIMNSYVLDFAKHAPPYDIPKITLIWDSIPAQLARENKKFIFSAVKKSARGREYEGALGWLEDTGLINKALLVTQGKYPLKGYINRSSFKVYALDVGLLGAMAEVPVDILAKGNRLFSEYEGAFVENYAAQQLKSSLDINSYYWKREGKMAEVDFICEINDEIYPMEVKAGANIRSKSLKSYNDQFHPKLLIMTTLRNFKCDGIMCNFPLYAISKLPSLIGNVSIEDKRDQTRT